MTDLPRRAVRKLQRTLDPDPGCLAPPVDLDPHNPFSSQVFYTINRERRIAYLGIFKVGATTMRFRLAEMAGLNIEERRSHRYWTSDIHVPIDSPEVADFFKFTFVRHPLARMVSVWRNKLDPTSEHQHDLSPWGMEKGMAFPDFVEAITAWAPEQLDHHLRPQRLFVFFGDKLRVDYIGRLENAFAEYERLRPILQDEQPLQQLNSTGDYSWEDMFSPVLRAKAALYYHMDMDFFGYC